MLLPRLAPHPQYPRDAIASLEARPHLHRGPGEHFVGYAILGVTFESGDTLALRRYAATSVGPAYTSVWHRSPAGRWTVYQDIATDAGCGRYFSTAADVVRAGIRVVWSGASRFGVVVDAPDRALTWMVALTSTRMTRIVSRLTSTVSRAPAWPAVTGACAVITAALLRSGRFSLSGVTPNGFLFETHMDVVWTVADSHAAMAGRSLGQPRISRASRIRLGTVDIPRRGLFATIHSVGRRTRQPLHGMR